MRTTAHLLSVLLLLAATAQGETASSPGTSLVSKPWDRIAPYMTPPADLREQYGKYPDVRTCDDGSQVKTPGDWQRRRAEILRYWHQMLGAWDPVIEKPRLEFKEKETVENVTRHKVLVQISSRRTAECYLLVPQGKGPFPAVLVTWYTAAEAAGITEKGKDRPTYAFGYDLATRGFVTLCMGGVGSDNVREDRGEKGIQPLSYAAYCAANACNALANLPEVDPKRIGVTGFSFGGKWAMFASCLYEKFACAVWVDPGIVWNETDPNANYWEPWYLGYDPATQRKPGVPTKDNPRTGPYAKLVQAGHDLNELHALMAPRPFLVSGGAQDPLSHWVALNGTIRLYEMLGAKDCVGMTVRNGHTPTPESNEQMYAFFEHFLKP